MGFSAGVMVAGYFLQVLVSGALILGMVWCVANRHCWGSLLDSAGIRPDGLVYLLRLMGPSLPSRLGGSIVATGRNSWNTSCGLQGRQPSLLS